MLWRILFKSFKFEQEGAPCLEVASTNLEDVSNVLDQCIHSARFLSPQLARRLEKLGGSDLGMRSHGMSLTLIAPKPAQLDPIYFNVIWSIRL